MKKFIWCLVAFVATFVVTPGLATDTDSLTKQQQFALELELCQEAFASGTPSKCDLYGKIEFVDSFPDVKIQEVSSFPDIKVEMVSSFADSPGQWQEVDSFPDYKVQMVDSFPDYKVEFVTSFPGCD